jgi:hypothetical protein
MIWRVRVVIASPQLSLLNVVAGSTFAARRAGSHAAVVAVPTMIATVATNVAGSVGERSKR